MTSRSRRAYIDWVRGVAVLLMIEAHTIDAWTRAADTSTTTYGYLTILGGFAAPLFLWLAGLGSALSATRTAERTGSRSAAVDAICRRGLEIFLLAFLFRLQAFVVSPGSHPVTLFRVDVLNIMGPAIAVAGLLWAASSGTAGRIAIYAVAAALVALVTPIVRASPVVDTLPTWVQWYMRPAGEYTTFTLFPWSGFVFAGAAAGAILARVRGDAIERRALQAIGLAGALLVAVGFYTASLPSIYAASSFWTSSPTWFAIRAGVLMAGFALVAAIPEGGGVMRAWQTPLAVLGRASLFVYWIHVELVYGYASWLWRHRLPVWLSVAAYLAFTALMFAAVRARDRYVVRRAARIPPPVTLSEA
jgi:uncharacterized membrane protein